MEVPVSAKITTGNVWVWIVLGLIALLAVRYLTLGKIRKHYINNIFKQIPYLLARYLV